MTLATSNGFLSRPIAPAARERTAKGSAVKPVITNTVLDGSFSNKVSVTSAQFRPGLRISTGAKS